MYVGVGKKKREGAAVEDLMVSSTCISKSLKKSNASPHERGSILSRYKYRRLSRSGLAGSHTYVMSFPKPPAEYWENLLTRVD